MAGAVRGDAAARVVIAELFVADDRCQQFPVLAALPKAEGLQVDPPKAVGAALGEHLLPEVHEGRAYEIQLDH